ncbi:hypothetical protein GSI_14131 [Ganoderma sinense ZZ0214-1]|uniref:AB hydrolase-1 domain-containing protein n=1 Tax=Ganoderma sinense ZZ0214-1 TaxID=1077348 RepID=A0A2G8RSR0_9APHY|nr:hypothetical protein GSI_14131 [Ganoderma sinense ZZ0214-1]
MPSMVVDDKGTQLSYIDSGIPARVAGAFIQHYVTIFALHGFYFTNHTFEKVMAHASEANVRFVAISRRDYPGSTAFSPQDLSAFSSSDGEDRRVFLRDRGAEIATFICNFIEQNGLLPISSDGKSGGFAVVGYGFGSVFALAAVANLDTLSVSFQTRWGAHMRGLLLHDPLAVSVGKPRLPAAWGPRNFPSFMLDKQWQTGYFNQWDMNARNLGMHTYDINPSLARLPTVDTMTEEEIARVFHDPIHHSSDIPLAVSCGLQVKANYKKACFDQEIRALVPDMKVWVFSGDLSQPFSLPAFWAVENDNAARGGGFVNFRIVHSVNHYVLWVDPALTLRIYLEALGLNG